jgi:hypothetical protein
LEFRETAEEEDLFSWFAAPPLATFVALWLERDVALADCWVGATWIVDWFCSEPPTCVGDARWMVVLSFSAVEDDAEELACTLCVGSAQSSAAAVRGARPAAAKKAVHASTAHKHLHRLPMELRIAAPESAE